MTPINWCLLFNKSNIIFPRSRLVDTSLLIYFFGKRGDGDLGFDDFKKFMDNLQTEVLQMEYNEFAKGCATITEMDFARLIYSQVSYSGYLRQTQGLNWNSIYAGRLKKLEVHVVKGGQNLPLPLVEIGLSDVPKIGGWG